MATVIKYLYDWTFQLRCKFSRMMLHTSNKIQARLRTYTLLLLFELFHQFGEGLVCDVGGSLTAVVAYLHVAQGVDEDLAGLLLRPVGGAVEGCPSIAVLVVDKRSCLHQRPDNQSQAGLITSDGEINACTVHLYLHHHAVVALGR